MSEPEERPYAVTTEEPSADETGIEMEAGRSTIEEQEQEQEQVPEQEEKVEVKKQPKKNRAESKKKEVEFSIASLSKQLPNYLARLEEVLPSLRSASCCEGAHKNCTRVT